MTAGPILAWDGDPYTLDPSTGEWLEQHHTHDADDVAAVRAYVDEAMAWRRSV